MNRVQLNDLADTEKFGRALAELARAGDLICLQGDLGAGKTTLVQAIARGLGVEGWVNSPSFALLHEYSGRLPLYHMDFYRLNSSDEIIAIGLDEYFASQGLTVIEWAERAEDILPPEKLCLSLHHTGEYSRLIKITASAGFGDRLEPLLRAFSAP
ncbi:MAG: tRNA (adenosine(37)-N6)-threonylcarbamoyltransferase complex ATPase subunit type 1 TsaE [Desulforhopalus sp.]|jgi:tRNA threonylcarbamoyladenosine biosynthesis protein TsaE|nr:tRNA (adenosine(37)-N6)-threonylcarbamoyltransferase complex ATPase subunit type 1 TsaE [Desulforhopalus sp.]